MIPPEQVQAEFARPLPHQPVDRRADRSAAGGPEEPTAGPTPNVSTCARSMATSSGGIGTTRVSFLARHFRPHACRYLPSSVHALPGASAATAARSGTPYGRAAWAPIPAAVPIGRPNVLRIPSSGLRFRVLHLFQNGPHEQGQVVPADTRNSFKGWGLLTGSGLARNPPAGPRGASRRAIAGSQMPANPLVHKDTGPRPRASPEPSSSNLPQCRA